MRLISTMVGPSVIRKKTVARMKQSVNTDRQIDTHTHTQIDDVFAPPPNNQNLAETQGRQETRKESLMKRRKTSKVYTLTSKDIPIRDLLGV